MPCAPGAVGPDPPSTQNRGLSGSFGLQSTAAGAILSRRGRSGTLGGLMRRRLRAVLLAVALDAGTK